MTTAAKAVYLGALLIGLSVGAFWGFREEGSLLASLNEGKRLMAPMALVEFSVMQYEHADAKYSESALQTTARLLESMEKLQPEKVHKLALATTYTRLALLWDAASDAQQSSECMVKARYWYKASGGQDYPESEMKTRLKAFDRSRQ